VKNAGRPDHGDHHQGRRADHRYQSGGETGQGHGVKAGVAYRMEDGSLVYVPE